jgi:hypothetical protein
MRMSEELAAAQERTRADKPVLRLDQLEEQPG